MAQHIRMEYLEEHEVQGGKEKAKRQILSDLDRYLESEHPLHARKITQLPDDYLWEVNKADGYTPYLLVGIEAVEFGTVEVHYKSPEDYIIYVVA